ncbi:hypothetical protein SAMN04487996_1388 [Dyadobacter soli]|uniref:Uncharacterized protein n=1 Tax=Dyadobacter soli TaxID=659014 RepID=A0A1G8CIF9_9BACT|nr:hypothetical protein [Dyadobacter soli]SDH45215.1 hypothetical protein SAMN04487996_1388 [Dyadobacter soli]
MYKTTTRFLGVLLALIVMLGIGVNLLPSVFGFILFRADDYGVLNEQRRAINAWVFEKKQTSENHDTDELIVYFPSEQKYRYLTVVPEHQLIGLADRPADNIWVAPGSRVAYMFPNGSFFIPLDGPYFELISEFEFSKNVIWFNTFDDLKKFGSRIVINRTRTGLSR